MLCAFWAGNFSFISAKTFDLDVKKNCLHARVLLSIQTQSLNRKLVF